MWTHLLHHLTNLRFQKLFSGPLLSWATKEMSIFEISSYSGKIDQLFEYRKVLGYLFFGEGVFWRYRSIITHWDGCWVSRVWFSNELLEISWVENLLLIFGIRRPSIPYHDISAFKAFWGSFWGHYNEYFGQSVDDSFDLRNYKTV